MDVKGYKEKLDRLKAAEVKRTLEYLKICFGRHMHILDLSNHYLFERAVKKLCSCLSKTTVKGLVLKNCTLTPSTLLKVLRALKPEAITTLDIANNRLTATAELGAALGEFFAGSKKPKSLVLQGNVVEDGEALTSLFSYRFSLAELNLYDTNLSEEAVLALSSALVKNCCISTLNLGFNSDGFASSSTIRSFAVGVSQNQHLTSLTVSGNENIGQHFEDFCQGVAGNRSLQTLALASVGIGDDGLESLAELLSKCPVTGVDLQNNEMSDAGVSVLMQSLPTTVAYLDLSYNDIRDSSTMLSIAAQLMQTRSLRRLNLSHSLELEELDESILGQLCEALLTNDSLTEFFCEGVKISDDPDGFCRMINEAISMRKLSLTYKISAVNCYPNSQTSILRSLSQSVHKIISDIPSRASSSNTGTERREFTKEYDENANTSRQYVCQLASNF